MYISIIYIEFQAEKKSLSSLILDVSRKRHGYKQRSAQLGRVGWSMLF